MARAAVAIGVAVGLILMVVYVVTVALPSFMQVGLPG